MKKFKILALVAIMLFTMIGVPAYAASGTYLTIEGENYTECTFTPSIITGTGFSQGTYFQARHGLEKGGTHEVSYTFEVDKGGRYGFEIIASIFNVEYTTDYTISINDETMIDVSSVATKLADITTDPMNNVFKHYYLGNYYFQQGTNKVTFHMKDADRAAITDFVTTFIDCFYLTVEDFAIGTVSTPETCNVYEEGNDVQLVVTFKGLAPQGTVYNYEIFDFWGKSVASGTCEARPGSDSAKIDVGQLPVGWYQVKMTNPDGTSAFRDVAITVVPKLSERIEGDSPFAMDFAGTDVVANVDLVKNLAKAARYAGVQWVRERYNWNRIQTKKNGAFNFEGVDPFVEAIASEGIKISELFYGNPTWRNDTDLFDLYNVMKEAASHHNGKIQAWELYNEVDGNFQSWSGDTAAAIMKAMAIGVVDSGSNAQIAFGGLCRFVEGDKFIDLQTKNNMMDYSDIYNLHFHITENSEMIQDIMWSHYKAHRELKFHTGTEAKPMWITEAGIYQFVQDDDLLSIEQKQHTARYLVTSTAQSLATGTSKHFWFLLAPYMESGSKDMGIFDKYYEPSPAYAAEAVMTNVLGHGVYKGQTDIANAEGHVFDSGRGDVLVIWTDEPRYIELTSNNAVTLTDIMGDETVIEPVNGKVKVPVSFYPVYVSYNGEMPKEDYYAMSFKNDESLRVELTDAQRVILRQEFSDQPQEVAKGAGYRFKSGQDTHMELYLYNFNDKDMKGKVYGELEGYEFVMNQNVTIPAMSEISIPVIIRETKTPKYGVEQYLKFYAVFDGEETSPTVSITSLYDNEPEDPDYVNELALDPANWDVTNITAGAVATATVDSKDPSVMNFHLKFNGGGQWFYPYLNLGIDAQELADNYDGFMYWMRVTSPDYEYKGIPNVFAYLSDGRQYYVGQETGIPQQTDWIKVKRYWKDMILFTSPLGAEFDLRKIDPELITHIGIGTNPTVSEITYQIKGVGYFKAEPEEIIVKENIEFVSPDLANTRDRSQLSNVVITLPKGEYNNITMMLTDDVFENFKVQDNTIYADLSNVARGKYILRVLAEDSAGYVSSEEVDITID